MVASISEARANFSKLLNRLKQEPNVRIFISDRGKIVCELTKPEELASLHHMMPGRRSCRHEK